MTSLDDTLLPAITALLLELGTVVSIEEVTKSGNAGTGEVFEGLPVTHTPKAIPPFVTTDGFAMGDVRRVGKSMTGIAGEDLAFTPIPGMKLTLGTEKWEITSVEPVRSGDSVCLWMLFLNK